MAIELIRIDDRLIHGQVATTWLKDYQIEQVIIVDDETNNNDMQKTMVNVAAPIGVNVHVFSVAKFIRVTKNKPINKRTLLLFTAPEAVRSVLESGMTMSEIIIGGMRSTPERRRLSKAVHISVAEEAIFHELAQKGVSLIVQTVPRDEKHDLLKLF